MRKATKKKATKSKPRAAETTAIAMTPKMAPLAHLEPLREKAEGYAAAARSKNTIRAYRADWNDWSAWCADHNLEPLPASPETVGLYLADRAELLKVSTLRRRLSAISQAHVKAGHRLDTRHPAIRETWAGIRRTVGAAVTKKKPAVVDDVRAMVAAMDNSLLAARDRAILLLGFSGAFRRSEIVGLNVEDLELDAEGYRVTIRRSKTDQEGEGDVRGIPYGKNPATCPVRALQVWLELADIDAGPLFRAVNRWGQVAAKRLSSKSVAIVVKRRAEAAGFDPAEYAGHSLRSGHATSAAVAGVSLPSIMRQGNWKSEAIVRGYIRPATVFEDNSAKSLGL